MVSVAIPAGFVFGELDHLSPAATGFVWAAGAFCFVFAMQTMLSRSAKQFIQSAGSLTVYLAIVWVVFTWLDKPLDPRQWFSDVSATLQEAQTPLRPSERVVRPDSAPRNIDAPEDAEAWLAGRVLSVGDGDSLDVRVANRKIRVRLHQIDTPELNQPWGREAKKALARKVNGRTVRLEPNTVDDYGRLVATVWLGNRDINRELVRQGHAWVYRRYLEDRTLIPEEAAAKSAGRGLWGAENPVPPWEWRRR